MWMYVAVMAAVVVHCMALGLLVATDKSISLLYGNTTGSVCGSFLNVLSLHGGYHHEQFVASVYKMAFDLNNTSTNCCCRYSLCVTH